MSILTIGARLATIQATITGVTSAYGIDQAPNTLHDTLLPAFINLPAEAEYDGWGSGDITEDRSWRMLLYIAPIQKPSDVSRKTSLVQPFFRRVIDAFADAQQLNDLAGIQQAWIESDEGLQSIEYAGQDYAGIEFHIRVVELFNTTVST